jgi:voltage-gated potassium channel
MKQGMDTFLKECFSDGTRRKRYHRMNLGISLLVFINVVLIMVATLSGLPAWSLTAIHAINAVITVFFAIEYFLRIKYTRLPLKKYVFSFSSIVDIIAIFPALLCMPFNCGASHTTLLRLLRVLRFFRTTKTVTLFKRVLSRTYRQLGLAFSMVGIVIVVFSSLLYYAEGPAQPAVFSNIFSCIWWVISALTTSGYISVYPLTVLGKIISSFIVILGVSLFAVPAGIITAGFIEEYKVLREKPANEAANQET